MGPGEGDECPRRKIRQKLDEKLPYGVMFLTAVLQIWFRETILAGPNFLGGAHGFERARHDLRGARAMLVIGGLRLEQFGVSEDDPELVVQPMEEETQFRRFFHGPSRDQFLDAQRAPHHA